MRVAPVLLLSLALLMVPVGMAGAQTDGGTNSEVRTTDDSATVEYRRSVAGTDYTERINFTTNDTTFAVNFQKANETGRQVNELQAQLHQLAEYEDENENGLYDAGEPVESSYALSEQGENVLQGPENGTVQWDNLTTSQVQSDDGQTGTMIHARGHFTGTGNPLGPVQDVVGEAQNETEPKERTFQIRIYVFDQPATVNGTEVDPGQVKVSLATHNYPFAKEGTQLALATETRSDQGLENASEADAGVQANDNIEDVDLDMLYTWNSTAEVDGSSEPVGTTRLDDSSSGNQSANESDAHAAGNDTERLYALSYERGDEVVHDPVTGVRLDGPQSFIDEARGEASDVPGWGAVAVLSTLGLAAVAARRRG